MCKASWTQEGVWLEDGVKAYQDREKNRIAAQKAETKAAQAAERAAAKAEAKAAKAAEKAAERAAAKAAKEDEKATAKAARAAAPKTPRGKKRKIEESEDFSE